MFNNTVLNYAQFLSTKIFEKIKNMLKNVKKLKNKS